MPIPSPLPCGFSGAEGFPSRRAHQQRDSTSSSPSCDPESIPQCHPSPCSLAGPSSRFFSISPSTDNSVLSRLFNISYEARKKPGVSLSNFSIFKPHLVQTGWGTHRSKPGVLGCGSSLSVWASLQFHPTVSTSPPPSPPRFISLFGHPPSFISPSAAAHGDSSVLAGGFGTLLSREGLFSKWLPA